MNAIKPPLNNFCKEIQTVKPEEPVAWRWLYDGKPEVEKFFPMPGPDADVIALAANSEFPRTVQYLYAAPQPAPEPLTDDEIADIYADNQINPMRFARSIERAHGITGDEE